MNSLPKRSIRTKLQTIMLLVSFTSIFLGYTVFVSWYAINQHKKNIETVETIANVLSQNFAKLIFLDDIKEAVDITTTLRAYPEINKLILYNKNKKIVYKYAKNQKSFTAKKLTNVPKEYEKTDTNKLILFHKINYQNMQLGYMYAQMKTESIMEIIIDDLPSLLAIWIALMLFSIILAHYFSQSFSKPILKLAKFLNNVDLTQEEEQKIQTHTDTKEFQILFDKVNELLKSNEKANKKLKIASVAFEIDNGMIVTDEAYRVLQVNKAYTSITGFSQTDVIGEIPPVLKNKLDKQELYENMQKEIKKHFYWNGDIKSKRKDGSVFIEHLSIYAVTDSKNNISHYIFSFLDVTKQKEIEGKLKYLQEYDSLTGLLNKEPTLEKIDKNLSSNGVFISIDILKFKEINRLYGYEAGDIILKKLSHTIQKVFPEAIAISRVESNQFIVYNICKKARKDDIIVEAQANVEYLLSLLHEKPFTIQDNSISIEVVIGLVLTENQDNSKTLFEKGHKILEEAKNQKRNIMFFDKDIMQNILMQENLYPQLLKAIKNNELELYYQLQYNAEQKPYAAEALIRWNHPQKGLISPALFIPLAEKTGLISQIGRLVLNLGCKQLEQWQKDTLTKDLLLSINLGAKHFQEDDLVKQVEKIVQKYNFPPQNLKIELTEYTMVDNIEKVAKKMEELRSIGIRISLDDFGTGFSSLQYLQFLPIDQLKIDQAFVMDMIDNKTNIAIIKSIIVLTQALNIEVIAEGVETEKLYKKLLELGCKHFQGYYFAKPQQISQVNAKIRER